MRAKTDAAGEKRRPATQTSEISRAISGSITGRVTSESGRPLGDTRVQVVGTPLSYIPHGSPDAILRELGLGPLGIAEHARQLVLSSTSFHPAGA